MIAWQNDPDRYAVATLTTTGAVLALAESDAAGPVQWFSRWIAEGGHSDSAILAIDGQTARILQGENAGQGLLVVWTIVDGISSNDLVLMLLGEGYANASSSGALTLRDKATLPLIAQATLNHIKVFTLLPMKAQAALNLNSVGHLFKYKTLQAKAKLTLTAKALAANAIPGPSGLNALMKIISDPLNVESILDQYLRVWFNGHPHQQRLSLQIDHEPAFQPPFIWENPGITQGAVLKIDGAAIPGDGLTHQITVRVWQAVSGKTSLPSVITLFAKTPKPQFIEQPEWCRSTVIRQGDGLMISDLTRLEWRHPGAVKIMAQYEVRHSTGRLSSTQSTVGYADDDQDTFIAENLGELIFIGGTSLKPVTLGVCALGNNEFGPPLWADPVLIKQRPPAYAYTPAAPPHPDLATRMEWKTEIVPRSSYALPTPFNAGVRSAVAQQLAITLNATSHTIVDQTIYRAHLKIKDILRKGGRVTLDDFGIFEARWNHDRTTRRVAFVPSIGFKDGVQRGTRLTDAQAKALYPSASTTS